MQVLNYNIIKIYGEGNIRIMMGWWHWEVFAALENWNTLFIGVCNVFLKINSRFLQIAAPHKASEGQYS